MCVFVVLGWSDWSEMDWDKDVVERHLMNVNVLPHPGPHTHTHTQVSLPFSEMFGLISGIAHAMLVTALISNNTHTQRKYYMM